MDPDELESLYERVVTSGGVVDRTGRGLLRLAGPQRIWFLQNTVTSDVESLETGSWGESCFLTPKGKMLSHLRVGVLDDEVWLDVDPPVADLADWFLRYRFRTKVEVEDRSTVVSTVVGPAAEDLAGSGQILRLGEAVAFGDRLADLPVVDVHGQIDLDLPVVPSEVYEVLRVEAGVPMFGVDYTTDNLPQEAGLTRVVSVEKGCYVGQETVARIHFRGHINKVVRPVTLEGVDPDTAVGREVRLDGARVGDVTSAVRSPRRGAVGIAMVSVMPEAGARLEVEGGGTAVLGGVPEGTKVKKA